MIRVNCASVPRELFESEFFGQARPRVVHGAVRDRAGRFDRSPTERRLRGRSGER
jgi:transcriptional regulator with GAF, ATPase, and Fis domain